MSKLGARAQIGRVKPNTSLQFFRGRIGLPAAGPPGIQLGLVGKHRTLPVQPMNRQTPDAFPALYSSHTALQVTGDLFPGIQAIFGTR